MTHFFCCTSMSRDCQILVLFANHPSLFLLFCCFFFLRLWVAVWSPIWHSAREKSEQLCFGLNSARTALGRLVVSFDSAAACFRDAVRAHVVCGFGRVLGVLWLSEKKNLAHASSSTVRFIFLCVPFAPLSWSNEIKQELFTHVYFSPGIDNAVVVWVEAEGTNKQRKCPIVVALWVFRDKAALNLLMKNLSELKFFQNINTMFSPFLCCFIFSYFWKIQVPYHIL